MILDEIAEKTKERVATNKRAVAIDELKAKCAYTDLKKEYAFEKALKKDALSFICEVKKASPSKGVIAEDFPYLDIAKAYEAAGADCISCLTEPFWFKGADEYLKEIKNTVSIPVLRKDFTVDEYMIYEAKCLNADCILLICAILSDDQLQEYYGIAKDLGMSVIVECHDESEIEMALRCKANIIGVNNRNLKDFTVDINNSIRLRNLVPRDKIFISESGMKTKEDIATLRDNGVNAVLIGETLMRAADKKAMIDELRK